MSDTQSPLLVIGGGAMASAILRGAADGGSLPDRVCVVEPDEHRRAAFDSAVASADEGLAWLEAIGAGGTVLLAVKPQMLDTVGEALSPSGVGARLVISIHAGVGGERVRSSLGGRCRIVRAMPNTPAQIGMGTTALARSVGAESDDVAAARDLFAAVGDVVVELDEPQMDAFTAIAGSGPAYLFFLAEAMERAAAEVGLPEAQIRRIVANTLAGSADLLRRAGDDPAELRARVTSKGGTTAAAIGVFDRAGLATIVADAVRAARDRGRELGA